MMLDFLEEPELEFGGGGRHIDIRFGIMEFGPSDLGASRAPSQIRVGIVGAPANVEGAREWMIRCREEIAAKSSKQPSLFPRFPGFAPDRGFRSTLVLDSEMEREIPARDFERIARGESHNAIIQAAADRFIGEMEHLKERRPVDVVLCAVPPEVEALMDPDQRPRRSAANPDPLINFRGLLKARAMELGVTTQLILPGTYDRSKRKKQKIKKDVTRPLQDEATSAWNFHTALYYKAGGLPWRVVRDRSDYATCYVGISFYFDLDRSNLVTSMAQVFDERGDGIVVRGAPIKLSKDDRTAHLSEADAQALLMKALQHYRREHGTAPARVVLHKTSRFDPSEREGFAAAADEERIDRVDFVSVTDRDAPRLFRNGPYPPLRGTFLTLSEKEHVLYTRGSVDFFATYPGMYVPQPLHFRRDETVSTPRTLAREILVLTKMNWNKSQFDQTQPITIGAARNVGEILKYVDGDRIETRYSYYM